MDGFGSSPRKAAGQRFTLRSQHELSDPGSQAVILLVEDNPADAALVCKALEHHGVAGSVTVLSDGEQAIDHIQKLEACPDLVIIDLNLPKRHGREVLECLRSNKLCGHVPVMILSSSDAAVDRADAARLGADRYLSKPSRLDEFLALGAIFKATLRQG